MPIFIDESGFTGNDLLEANQPHFVMSSVSISDDDAQYLVNKVRTDFRINAEVDELKAANLLRTTKGMNAIKYILYNIQGRYAFSANHKSYVLCCKIFEYIFEPVLQKNKTLFYSNSFQLFIANTIFVFFVNKDKVASEIMISFAKMMREQNFDALRVLFSNKTSLNTDDVFLDMIDFMKGYSDAIIEELNIIKDTGEAGKWILDISGNAFWSLLRHWAKSHDELTIICDDSDPLVALNPHFDKMISGADRSPLFHPITGRCLPILNLKRRVQFKDSSEVAGIQLADIVAGSAAYALKNKDADLLNILNEGSVEESIFPTLENADLTKKQPTINAVVLKELANRARNNYDPLLDMAAYYEFISEQYDTSPPEIK